LVVFTAIADSVDVDAMCLPTMLLQHQQKGMIVSGC
jgi:hypothetical protein